MAEAEIEESAWFTQETAEKIENQFHRYGINLSSNYENILNNDNKLKWPKWFEGATVNLAFECLDRQTGDDTYAFGYYAMGDGHEITSRQLSSKVTKFTEALAPRVNSETGRVLIILPTCLEAVISILACLKLGVLFSIMEPSFTQCIYLRLNEFKPHVVITANRCKFDPLLIHSVRSAIDMMDTQQPTSCFVVMRNYCETQALLDHNVTLEFGFYSAGASPKPVEFRPYCINKPLYVAYTAGTTGQPKGCVHSALSLYMSSIMDDGFTVNPQTCNRPVSFFYADLSNIVGLIGIILKPLLFGVPSVLYEAGEDPTGIYTVIYYSRVTSAYISKSNLKRLKLEDADGELAKSYYHSDFRLKTVFTSGSGMDKILKWTKTLFSQQFPLQVYNFYAITELGGIIFTDHSDTEGQPFSRRTTGRLVPFIYPKVMKSPRAFGITELFIKLPLSPMIMISYYENNDLFFENFCDVEGHYATGDPAAIDENGNIVFLERNLTFNEAELIPKLERDISSLDFVQHCCVLCKTVKNIKRLYGFFQLKLKYSENDPGKCCEEIQGFVRYLNGSFINFKAFNILQMPLRRDRKSPDRNVMSDILHDISKADKVKDYSIYDSFVEKVKEINQRPSEYVD